MAQCSQTFRRGLTCDGLKVKETDTVRRMMSSSGCQPILSKVLPLIRLYEGVNKNEGNRRDVPTSRLGLRHSVDLKVSFAR
jgi:hypothetical protein